MEFQYNYKRSVEQEIISYFTEDSNREKTLQIFVVVAETPNIYFWKIHFMPWSG